MWRTALSQRSRQRLLRWLVFVVAGAIVGEIYTNIILMPTTPQQRIWLPGARAGAMIAGAISGLEIFFIHDRYGSAFRRLPFLLFLGLRVAAHTGLVVLMLAVNARIGMWHGESFGIDMLEPRQLVRNTVFSLVMFTVALFTVVLFTGQMRGLIGGRALTNDLLGATTGQGTRSGCSSCSTGRA